MKKKKVKILIFSLIFALAIVFVVYGLKNDGFRDVKNKAVRICTECIGLG
ncbi:MAG: hypothetical protein K5669_03820 [Lachnospiraceae bacterium]|nr:hypothetical protein [Lachnospiraceae bacterium]